MPTEKKRIHVTVNDDTYKALGRLADKRGETMAGVGLRLIEQTLEYQEDHL